MYNSVPCSKEESNAYGTILHPWSLCTSLPWDNYNPHYHSNYVDPTPLSSIGLYSEPPATATAMANPSYLPDVKNNANPQQVPENPPAAEPAAPAAKVAVDWLETASEHVFKADVPGLKKEDVKVEVANDKVLCIKGEKKGNATEKGDGKDLRHRSERSKGKFKRKFKLPRNANVEQIKASLTDGLLTITIPKMAPKEVVITSD